MVYAQLNIGHTNEFSYEKIIALEQLKQQKIEK